MSSARPRTRVEEVTDRPVTAIAVGEHPAGPRLPAERELAGNRTPARVLGELEAQLSIGAPAHLWGQPDGMRAKEERAEHDALVHATEQRRADDAEAIARAHAGIDLELLEAAGRRASAAVGGLREVRTPVAQR